MRYKVAGIRPGHDRESRLRIGCAGYRLWGAGNPPGIGGCRRRRPYLIARGRWGYRMGDGHLYDRRDGLNDAFSDEHSGWHTEDLAGKFQIGREAQDQWALRSQQCFSAAQAAGKFKGEIVPIEVPGRKGATIFDTDEHNRPKTTLEALAALKTGSSRAALSDRRACDRSKFVLWR
jgi:acetyl-CoA acetyltransferase